MLRKRASGIKKFVFYPKHLPRKYKESTFERSWGKSCPQIFRFIECQILEFFINITGKLSDVVK